MHCYFDNLITIAKCFCKALRILQSNAQVWGAGPSSVFCSSVGVLCSPPSTTQTIWSFTRTEKNARTRSNSTLFWRQRLGCLSRLLALTTHQRSLFADEGEIGEKRKEGKKKKPTKNHITADQMGTFHMTKPINHLGGAQVQHSRGATHHFTVYRAQTHGHQSMAPRGPGGALSSLTGPCLMTS